MWTSFFFLNYSEILDHLYLNLKYYQMCQIIIYNLKTTINHRIYLQSKSVIKIQNIIKMRKKYERAHILFIVVSNLKRKFFI